MKRNNKVITLGLCAMLFFAAHVSAVDNVTITGTLYVLEWDDNDDVIQAVISGESGEYIIVNNAVGQELFEMAGAYVEVSGVIGKDAEGSSTITVLNYTLITN